MYQYVTENTATWRASSAAASYRVDAAGVCSILFAWQLLFFFCTPSCIYCRAKTLPAPEKQHQVWCLAELRYIQYIYLYLPAIRFPLEHNKTVSGHLSLYCSVTLEDKDGHIPYFSYWLRFPRKTPKLTGIEVLSVKQSDKKNPKLHWLVPLHWAHITQGTIQLITQIARHSTSSTLLTTDWEIIR